MGEHSVTVMLGTSATKASPLVNREFHQGGIPSGYRCVASRAVPVWLGSQGSAGWRAHATRIDPMSSARRTPPRLLVALGAGLSVVAGYATAPLDRVLLVSAVILVAVRICDLSDVRPCKKMN